MTHDKTTPAQANKRKTDGTNGLDLGYEPDVFVMPSHDKTTGLDPNILGASDRAALSQSPQGDVSVEVSYFHLANGYPHNNEVDWAIEYLKDEKNLLSMDTQKWKARAVLQDYARYMRAQELTARKVDAQTWQTVETAPDDGSMYLAWDDRAGMFICKFEDGFYKVVPYGVCSPYGDYTHRPVVAVSKPTHWMHLPPAPASDDGVK